MNRLKPAVYGNPYLAGIGLGLVLLAAFVLVGRGLGASGAMTRLSLYTAHNVETAVAGGTEAAHEVLERQNDYVKKYLATESDPLMDFLVYMFLGILLGGFLSGTMARRVSFQVIRGPRASLRTRLLLAFAGGIISAYGARLARGCTSGQALSGGATLAAGSWAYLVAVFAGGFAVAYFFRKEWT